MIERIARIRGKRLPIVEVPVLTLRLLVLVAAPRHARERGRRPTPRRRPEHPDGRLRRPDPRARPVRVTPSTERAQCARRRSGGRQSVGVHAGVAIGRDSLGLRCNRPGWRVARRRRARTASLRRTIRDVAVHHVLAQDERAPRSRGSRAGGDEAEHLGPRGGSTATPFGSMGTSSPTNPASARCTSLVVQPRQVRVAPERHERPFGSSEATSSPAADRHRAVARRCSTSWRRHQRRGTAHRRAGRAPGRRRRRRPPPPAAANGLGHRSARRRRAARGDPRSFRSERPVEVHEVDQRGACRRRDVVAGGVAAEEHDSRDPPGLLGGKARGCEPRTRAGERVAEPSPVASSTASSGAPRAPPTAGPAARGRRDRRRSGRNGRRGACGRAFEERARVRVGPLVLEVRDHRPPEESGAAHPRPPHRRCAVRRARKKRTSCSNHRHRDWPDRAMSRRWPIAAKRHVRAAVTIDPCRHATSTGSP